MKLTKEERFLRDLGRKIAALANQQDKSLERLAYEAGVSKGYVYDIANGRGNPSIKILYRLAETLEVALDELLRKE